MSLDILNPNAKKSLPEDLVRLALSPTVLSGIKARYYSNYINPEQGNITYVGSTSTIMRFRLPSSCIDFTDSTLEFQCTQTGSGGTYLRLSQNAACVIQRMRILFGSQEVFLTENYNLLSTYLTLYNNSSYFNGLGTLFAGWGNAAYRNSQTNSGNTYMLHFGPFVELLDRIIPLNFINEVMTIEITLANPSVALESDHTTNLGYSLTNVEFHYDTIELDDAFNNLLKEKILSAEGLCIPYRQWVNYTDTSMVSGTVNAQVQLPYRYMELQGLISIMRNAANIATASVNDKMVSYTGFSNFVNSSLRINNVIFPSDRINNTNQVLDVNLEVMSKHYDDDIFIATNWNQYFSINFPTMQDGKGYNSDQAQGITASTSGFSIIHQLQLSSNTINIDNEYFAIVGCCMRILPNGGIKWSQ